MGCQMKNVIDKCETCDISLLFHSLFYKESKVMWNDIVKAISC